MQKLILQLVLTIAAIYLLMSTSTAQSIFFNNNQAPQSNYEPNKNTGSFAQNFANQVKSMNKRLQNESSQAIKDSMATVQLPPPTGPEPTSQAMVPPSLPPSTPSTPPNTTQPIVVSPATQPAPPVNRPVYTGFGTTTPGSSNSNTNTTSSPAGNTGGGWNINY